MGTIVIDSTPRKSEGDGFTSKGKFNLLNQEESRQTTNLGGKFALPLEFNSVNLASAFYLQGQESLSMQGPQPVMGTSYTAPGWKVWKYPAGHEKADKAHSVRGSREEEIYLLHYRPMDVQDQVNLAYGELSREQMVAEQRGERTSSADPNDPTGILSEPQLRRATNELEAEREIDEAEQRSTAVHGAGNSGPTITPKRQQVSSGKTKTKTK